MMPIRWRKSLPAKTWRRIARITAVLLFLTALAHAESVLAWVDVAVAAVLVLFAFITDAEGKA